MILSSIRPKLPVILPPIFVYRTGYKRKYRLQDKDYVLWEIQEVEHSKWERVLLVEAQREIVIKRLLIQYCNPNLQLIAGFSHCIGSGFGDWIENGWIYYVPTGELLGYDNNIES